MKKILALLTLGTAVNAFAADGTRVEGLAQEQGIKVCYEKLKNVAAFYIKDAHHSTHSVWNNAEADSRMYASLTSRRYSDGNSHINITSSPTANGSCDISYTETYALPSRCSKAREEIFSSWNYSDMMDERTILLENEAGNSNVYLTPQGEDSSMCLVSRREVIFG